MLLIRIFFSSLNFFYAMVLIRIFIFIFLCNGADKGKLLDFVETSLDSKEVINLVPGEQVFLLR